MPNIAFNKNTSGVSQNGRRSATVRQGSASAAADTIPRTATGLFPKEVWQRLDGGNGVTISSTGVITVTAARLANAELLVVGD